MENGAEKPEPTKGRYNSVQLVSGMSVDSEEAWSQPAGRSFHSDGIQSVVYRQRDATPRAGSWIAIKTVSFQSIKSVRPHDIVKEADILAHTSHPSIVSCLGFFVDQSLRQYELHTSLLPLSLAGVLDSPFLAPSPPPLGLVLPPSPIVLLPRKEALFDILVKSIFFQTATAVAYLHTMDVPIAHRDIKPGNVLISESGCVKLIDFGIAWASFNPTCAPNTSMPEQSTSPYSQEETPDAMVSQVGSGAYRAVELMFSPVTYDAAAIDLWSLGALLSSFFTSIRLVRRYSWEDEDENSTSSDLDEDSEQVKALPFIFSRRAVESGSMQWVRDTLFNASEGELGYIWSVFKVRGTPNATSWPGFSQLPGARMMSFQQTAAANISNLLPNLPASYRTIGPSSPLDLIERLLVYDPGSRLRAPAILEHPWFSSGAPLILPRDYSYSSIDICVKWETLWDGIDLAGMIAPGVRSAYALWEASSPD